MSKEQWIKENLKEGEKYAGLILGASGQPDYHLVLLPGRDNKEMSWAAAMKQAVAEGGDLPTRREQSLLFANLKGEFHPRAYWSKEQHAAHGYSAWCQGFDDGDQYSDLKSASLRARAVRRLIIQ